MVNRMKCLTVLVVLPRFVLALHDWEVLQEGSDRFMDYARHRDRSVKLPSGLIYKPITFGMGDHHPLADSPCECHYTGWTAAKWDLGNGKESFDSSYDRGKEPMTFTPNQVIQAWTEALQLMKEGDKWELYVPTELAYGSKGNEAGVKPDEALVFHLELVKIKGEKKIGHKCDVKIESCNLETNMDSTCGPGGDSGCLDWEKEFVKRYFIRPREHERYLLENVRGIKNKHQDNALVEQKLKLLTEMDAIPSKYDPVTGNEPIHGGEPPKGGHGGEM